MDRPLPPTRIDDLGPLQPALPTDPVTASRRDTDLPAVRANPSPVLDPDVERVPETHMLPPHVGKAGRIGDHLAALSADLREWTELQIALVQRKVEGVVGIFERVQHLQEAIAFYAIAAVMGLLGAFFILVTLAIGLGALIGHYWGGFLIVTLLLLLIAGVAAAIGRRKHEAAKAKAAADKRERRAARESDLDDVRAAQAASVRHSVS